MTNSPSDSVRDEFTGRIFAGLGDRGLLEGIDDLTLAEIADEIARHLTAALSAERARAEEAEEQCRQFEGIDQRAATYWSELKAAEAERDALREAVEGLRELSEKATFGPWEVHRVPWTAWTGATLFDKVIRTVGIHPQLKDHSPIVGLSDRLTEHGHVTGLWIMAEDAELIVAAVNFVRSALAAIRTRTGGENGR